MVKIINAPSVMLRGYFTVAKRRYQEFRQLIQSSLRAQLGAHLPLTPLSNCGNTETSLSLFPLLKL